MRTKYLFIVIAFVQISLSAQQFKTVKEIWTTPFKSQGETNSCWSFSTTSFLESEAYRLGRGEFDLSQMFTVYYAYMEKALRHVRSHNIYPFRQGGLAHDVLFIISKYGAVPRSVYPGYINNEKTYDHTKLFTGLNETLDEVSKSGPAGNWHEGKFHYSFVDTFTNLLDQNIGPLPQSFDYNGRKYTPSEFSSEVLNLPLQDYVEITSYSMFPFYSRNEMLLPDNWLHASYYNVPLEDFMRILDNALEKGFSASADLHVTGKELRSEENYVLGIDEEKGLNIYQRERDEMLETWRVEDIHLEHLIGTAVDKAGKKFFKAKDSLGSDKGDGPLYNKEYFSENFVKSRVLSFMIHKDALPEDISAKLGIK